MTNDNIKNLTFSDGELPARIPSGTETFTIDVLPGVDDTLGLDSGNMYLIFPSNLVTASQTGSFRIVKVNEEQPYTKQNML